MGFVERIPGGKDPDSDWARDVDLDLVVDLDNHTFCGIRLGDQPEAVAKLGSPDAFNEQTGAYQYPSDGFDVEITNGVIDCFFLTWGAPDRGAYKPFEGGFIHKGEPVELGAATREADFTARFGDPYWRDEDDDEILLFYEFGNVEWQVEFDKEGALKTLLITTPPLLAKPDQRESYGVDKPWPPA